MCFVIELAQWMDAWSLYVTVIPNLDTFKEKVRWYRYLYPFLCWYKYLFPFLSTNDTVMVAEANARPATMRLLDKVPIRRVSDTAAHQILKLQTQRLWVSTATTWYIHFRMDRGWYILNCLLLLFVIQCCNVYYCWQVCCFVILACSKSFSGTLGDRNTQTCNGKYTEELFQAKWFLDMSLFRKKNIESL